MAATFIIVFALLLPVGWIVSEATGKTVGRRIFGALTIVSACLIGWGVGMLQQLNYNSWYGGASKDLLEAVALSLPSDSPQKKILDEAASAFKPTYENRANYTKLVDEVIQKLKDKEPPK